MSDIDAVLQAQSAIVGHPWAESIAVFLARGLVVLVPAVGFLAWAIVRRDAGKAAIWHALAEAAWSAGLALLIVNAAAALVARPRPFQADARIIRLVPAPMTTSYPSGHTATAFAMAGAFWRFRRSAGAAAGAAAVLVAFGRLAVGVHHPSDLMAGAAVGVSASLLTAWGHDQLRRVRGRGPAAIS